MILRRIEVIALSLNPVADSHTGTCETEFRGHDPHETDSYDFAAAPCLEF